MRDNQAVKGEPAKGGRTLRTRKRAARGWWMEKESSVTVMSSVSDSGRHRHEGCSIFCILQSDAVQDAEQMLSSSR